MKTRILLLVLMLAPGWIRAQWTQTNGPPGGTVAVEAVLLSGDNILAGTLSNGMYLSQDHGMSWKRIEPYIETVMGFASLGEYIFVCTLEEGALRSSDQGITWTKLPDEMPGYVNEFAVRGNRIYAGAIDLYWSDDYGDSWTKGGDTNYFQSGLRALAVSGNKIVVSHFDEGVFLSMDDGSSWTDINNELEGKSVISLAISGDYIFAGTSNDGVFRSNNNGASWTQVNNGLTNLTITSFLVNETSIFAGTINGGVCRSKNNGDLWTKANTGLNDYLSVLTMASDGPDFILGTNGAGVYLSENSGNSWYGLHGFPCTWISSLVTNSSAVFAGTFNDGLFRSTDNGNNWIESDNGIPFWYNIISLANSGSNLYAGTSGGVFVSTDNGNSWSGINNGLPENLHVLSILTVGENIFLGTADFGVYRSSDKGLSWTPINNGLTFNSIGALISGDGLLFAGTAAGVFLSQDNGSTWFPVNQGLTDLYVHSLAIMGSNIIAGTYGDGGGVFISANNGDSWTQVLPGLQITSFTISNENIFASSYSSRIFLSSDNGLTWNEVDVELTYVNITALAVSGTNIFAGTQSAGVFINSSLLTSVPRESATHNEERIYPNPASNIITIEVTDLMEGSRLAIFNTNGQKILDQRITELQSTIDISALPSGLYLLQYGNSYITSTGRFVKE